MKYLLMIGLCGTLFIGCDKLKNATEKQPAPPAVASVAAAPSVAAGPIAVEEDLEVTAAAAINPANVKQEVAKLEAEIGH